MSDFERGKDWRNLLDFPMILGVNGMMAASNFEDELTMDQEVKDIVSALNTILTIQTESLKSELSNVLINQLKNMDSDKFTGIVLLLKRDSNAIRYITDLYCASQHASITRIFIG